MAIAVLRFPPRISRISVRGYAQKCLRTHRWPLGLVSKCFRRFCVDLTTRGRFVAVKSPPKGRRLTRARAGLETAAVGPKKSFCGPPHPVGDSEGPCQRSCYGLSYQLRRAPRGLRRTPPKKKIDPRFFGHPDWLQKDYLQSRGDPKYLASSPPL